MALKIVTAATPSANDIAISNFLSGEGFTPQFVSASDFTPEAVSLLNSEDTVIITAESTNLAPGVGDALAGSLAGVLFARSGDVAVMTESGFVTGTLSEYRVSSSSVLKADILQGISIGDDIQIYSTTQTALFLRASKLGAGKVGIISEKSDPDKFLAVMYPANSTLANGQSVSNPMAYFTLTNFSSTTADYRLSLVELLSIL